MNCRSATTVQDLNPKIAGPQSVLSYRHLLITVYLSLIARRLWNTTFPTRTGEVGFETLSIIVTRLNMHSPLREVAEPVGDLVTGKEVISHYWCDGFNSSISAGVG